MSRKRSICVVVVAGLSATTALTASGGGSSGGTGSAGAAQSSGSSGKVTIGYINDLSGIYQTIGYPAVNGVRVAVNLVNQAGGITIGGKKYQLQLKTCEANSENAQAVACAQQLVRDDGLKIIMGGQGAEAPPVAAVTDPAGAIYINPSTALAQQLGQFKLVFNPLDGIALKIKLAVAAIKKTYPNVKTVAAVTADDPTGAALPLFEQQLKQVGIRFVDKEKYDIKAVDITPQLTRAKAAHPDLLFTGWTQTEVAPVIKANQTVNAAPNIYGWTGPGSCDLFKSQLGSAKFLSSELFGVDLAAPSTAAGKTYVAAYKKFVTSDPAAAKNPVNIPNMTYSLEYADAIPQLAKALETAGTTTDVAKISQALLATSIDGIQGAIKYGSDRAAQLGQEHCTVNVDGAGKLASFQIPAS
ncbi:MAG: branched-chain amino acid transport system substrate-binding protein [Baekduia sp.]|nr:branched-chain amino acid transport system substrate-binding protein [Baekduia sp.]